MSLHAADIKTRLQRFLDRRQMPKRLEGKGGAAEDEVRALVAAVARAAPGNTERLNLWWPEFEIALGEIGTGLWPTEREIRDAATVASQRTAKAHPGVEVERTPEVQIVAAKMDRGESVGEGWLYGRQACELIKAGAISRETMDRYRDGAFKARAKIYGQDDAEQWRDRMQRIHQEAKEMFRASQARGFSAPMPDKRDVPGEGFAA